MLKTILLKLIPFSSLKILFLKLLGAQVGTGVTIGYFSTIHTKNYSNIIIGNYVEIGHNVNIKVSRLNIGNFSIICNDVDIHGNGNIVIGQSCYIGEMNIDTTGGISIGDFFACSYGNISSHDYSNTWFNPGEKYEKFNVEIGNRVWTGASVSILNANIGDESLIAGGSIVLSNLPNNSFAIGNPARVIKKNELKKIDKKLIHNEDFQNEIKNAHKKYNIGFVNELVNNKEVKNAKYDIIICNIFNTEYVHTISTPVISLVDGKIYNMKGFVLNFIRSFRVRGIFIKD